MNFKSWIARRASCGSDMPPIPSEVEAARMRLAVKCFSDMSSDRFSVSVISAGELNGFGLEELGLGVQVLKGRLCRKRCGVLSWWIRGPRVQPSQMGAPGIGCSAVGRSQSKGASASVLASAVTCSWAYEYLLEQLSANVMCSRRVHPCTGLQLEGVEGPHVGEKRPLWARLRGMVS